MKSAILRASITEREHERLKLTAIRRKVPIQTHVGEVIRAGMAALDGKRGEKL